MSDPEANVASKAAAAAIGSPVVAPADSVSSEPAVDSPSADTAALDDDAGSDTETEATQQAAKLKPWEIIRKAAVDAAEYKDYLSYATVLDQVMSDPQRYDDEERLEILKALLEVLENNDDLVYEIGWDLPTTLLQYVESAYDFGDSIRSSPHIRTVMSIFGVLSEKGNPKELFLKGVEALANLNLTPDSEDDETLLSDDVQERYGDMKFYLAFELTFFSLRRIETKYPSRFLATAITALLQFVAANMDRLGLLSLGIILRRLFTFARDYETVPLTPPEEFTDEELILQQQLLQSYLTWVVDISFQRFSVRWSQRLYYELKAGLAMEDGKKRSEVYELNDYTVRITECVERLAQLTYTFDMDVMQSLRELIDNADAPAEEPKNPVEEGSSKSPFSIMSEDGLLMLATQIRFDYRSSTQQDMTFAELIKLSLKFYARNDGSQAPLGVQDALGFWGLWVTRDISPEKVRAVAHDDFNRYLQHLMVLSATSSDKESRFIAYSLTAKLLGLNNPDVSFNYIMDTLKECPFENVKDATVRILKTLVVPPSQSASVDRITDGVNSLGLYDSSESKVDAVIDLSEGERRKQVQDQISATLTDVLESGGVMSESLPILLSWLNFVTVVEVDRSFLKSFVSKVSKLQEAAPPAGTKREHREARRQRVGLLTLSVESVKHRWLD